MAIGSEMSPRHVLGRGRAWRARDASRSFVNACLGVTLLQVVVVGTLIELRHHGWVETVYAPALVLARAVTPDSLQFRGNVLLGFLWMVGSAVLYSVAAVALWRFLARTSARSNRP